MVTFAVGSITLVPITAKCDRAPECYDRLVSEMAKVPCARSGV